MGGDSGNPAVIPGKPDASPLVRSIEHADGASPMPPKQAKLSAAVIADLKRWIESGAIDPRTGEMAKRDTQADWSPFSNDGWIGGALNRSWIPLRPKVAHLAA